MIKITNFYASPLHQHQPSEKSKRQIRELNPKIDAQIKEHQTLSRAESISKGMGGVDVGGERQKNLEETKITIPSTSLNIKGTNITIPSQDVRGWDLIED